MVTAENVIQSVERLVTAYPSQQYFFGKTFFEFAGLKGSVHFRKVRNAVIGVNKYFRDNTCGNIEEVLDLIEGLPYEEIPAVQKYFQSLFQAYTKLEQYLGEISGAISQIPWDPKRAKDEMSAIFFTKMLVLSTEAQEDFELVPSELMPSSRIQNLVKEYYADRGFAVVKVFDYDTDAFGFFFRHQERREFVSVNVTNRGDVIRVSVDAYPNH